MSTDNNISGLTKPNEVLITDVEGVARSGIRHWKKLARGTDNTVASSRINQDGVHCLVSGNELVHRRDQMEERLFVTDEEVGNVVGCIKNCTRQLSRWNSRNRIRLRVEINKGQEELQKVSSSIQSAFSPVMRCDMQFLIWLPVRLRVLMFCPCPSIKSTRGLWRVVSKALSNRLRYVLGEVISDSQSSFIPGRLIFDNAIVGYECIHAMRTRRRKNGYMVLKLDMSKAYNRVEWDFLDKMMIMLGSSEGWVHRVMAVLLQYLILSD
ncbi:hypothetical protein Ddye_023838 [Dipteronia dyeriana]|uniref:Reverse transcriptase domain-containing protein n=1 Tax=Dipteronia dyeriana TaxID=168575 RepID=A0AAD9WTT3_9ROSI|nr:hypothetical protein Ddye_023838 [Dipteronia dyeriana]